MAKCQKYIRHLRKVLAKLLRATVDLLVTKLSLYFITETDCCIYCLCGCPYTYRRLDENPTERFAEEVTSVLLNMMDRLAISKEIFNYLGHRNHGPPGGFTLYTTSIRTRFPGGRLFHQAGLQLRKFHSLWITFSNHWSRKKNFSFNNEHYLQLKGTAMGTCMAPSYTNIFMDNLER